VPYDVMTKMKNQNKNFDALNNALYKAGGIMSA
jgi:hypothetical protein